MNETMEKCGKINKDNDTTPLVQDLSSSLERISGTSRFAYFLPNVFSKEECDAIISRCETKGFDRALLNVGRGRQILADDIRNSDRCIIDDPVAAEDLWQRILNRMKSADRENLLIRAPWMNNSHEREGIKGGEGNVCAVGCNERLRILRYDPGAYFKPHLDGCFRRGAEAGKRTGEVSYVTVQLYLNEGFGGGTTRFLNWIYDEFDDFDDEERNKLKLDVVPKTGSVLIFEHGLLHEGCVVTSGRKYALRTDVMYTNKGPGWEYANNPIVLDGSKSK